MYILALITGHTRKHIASPHEAKEAEESGRERLCSTVNRMNGTIGREKTPPECERPYLSLIATDRGHRPGNDHRIE